MAGSAGRTAGERFIALGRALGYAPKALAKELGIKENSIRNYTRRNNPYAPRVDLRQALIDLAKQKGHVISMAWFDDPSAPLPAGLTVKERVATYSTSPTESVDSVALVMGCSLALASACSLLAREARLSPDDSAVVLAYVEKSREALSAASSALGAKGVESMDLLAQITEQHVAEAISHLRKPVRQSAAG